MAFNATQVIAIRDKMKNNCNGYIIRIDDKIIFDSRKCFITWDDANHLVYAVKANNDPYTQAESPMVIMSATYESIIFIDYQI